MATEQELQDAYKLLRQFLNPTIKGKNTDALLKAMANGGADLIFNAQAVHDNLFIMSGEGRFLDRLLADRDLRRPGEVGLSDDDYRNLGVEVTTRKQVQDLILKILDIVYGYEYARAFTSSQELEPYALEDGDILSVKFDDANVFNIRFDVSQFDNIGSATAREIADVVTRSLRAQGHSGFGDVKNDGAGNYLVLVSPTLGPSSAIQIVGGKSQNVLKFPSIRPTSQAAGTQLQLTAGTGGVVRATWTAGPAPGFGKIRAGDYVNVFGSGFDVAQNQGCFTVTDSSGGSVGNAYVEWINPIGLTESVTLSDAEDLMFFEPTRSHLTSKPTYAAAYQTENKVLEVYLPALTRIVRRDRLDAAYLSDAAIVGAQEHVGNYIYDTQQNFSLGSIATTTTTNIDPSLNGLIEVSDASDFPDQPGFVIFGLGTARQEGPIPYLNRPSSNTIRVSPAYRFRYNHPSGTDINSVNSNSPIVLNPTGTDYQTYLTDMAGGRLYAQELIDMVVATGITLIFTILYPGNEGLGGWQNTTAEGKREWQEIFE
jgi:hypothetical protein